MIIISNTLVIFYKAAKITFQCPKAFQQIITLMTMF